MRARAQCQSVVLSTVDRCTFENRSNRMCACARARVCVRACACVRECARMSMSICMYVCVPLIFPYRQHQLDCILGCGINRNKAILIWVFSKLLNPNTDVLRESGQINGGWYCSWHHAPPPFNFFLRRSWPDVVVFRRCIRTTHISLNRYVFNI